MVSPPQNHVMLHQTIISNKIKVKCSYSIVINNHCVRQRKQTPMMKETCDPGCLPDMQCTHLPKKHMLPYNVQLTHSAGMDAWKMITISSGRDLLLKVLWVTLCHSFHQMIPPYNRNKVSQCSNFVKLNAAAKNSSLAVTKTSQHWNKNAARTLTFKTLPP